jgi:transcription elongation factor Elf1
MSIPYSDLEIILDAEFTCNHSNQEARVKLYRKSARVMLQCTACGHKLDTFPKDDIDPADLVTMPFFDDSLARLYKAKRQARRRELIAEYKAEEKADFWRKYSAYLSSDEWKAKRERVYRRERIVQNRPDPRCQQCYENEGCFVHHTSYRNVFEERTHQLILVCAGCHDEIHGVPPWPEGVV